MTEEFRQPKIGRGSLPFKGKQERFDHKVLCMMVEALDDEDGTGARELLRDREMDLSQFFRRWPDFPYRFGAVKVPKQSLVDLIRDTHKTRVWHALEEAEANYASGSAGLVFELQDETRLPTMVLYGFKVEAPAEKSWEIKIVESWTKVYRIVPFSDMLQAIRGSWRIAP